MHTTPPDILSGLRPYTDLPTHALPPTTLDEAHHVLTPHPAPTSLTDSLLTTLEHPTTNTTTDPTSLLHTLTTHTATTDQLEAHTIHTRARFAFTRILNTPTGKDDLALLFNTPTHDELYTAVTTHGKGTIPGYLATLLPREDLLTLAGTHNSTLPFERTTTATALFLTLGMTSLLHTIEEGTLPLNRLHVLRSRIHDLPLTDVQLLDTYLSTLNPRLSLGKFRNLAYTFLSRLHTPDTTPAHARATRRVHLTRFDNGTGELCLTGPLLPLEALYQRARATARALLRENITGLTLEPLPTKNTESTETSGTDGARNTGTNKTPAAASAGISVDPIRAHTCPPPTDGTHTAALSRAVLTDAGIRDPRGFTQLLFDLLTSARPETTTTLLTTEPDSTEDPDSTRDSGRAGGAGKPGSTAGSGDSGSTAGSGGGIREHEVRVLCPTNTSWLRRQATLNITVPATTLLRADNRPATLAGTTPLPAEFAREIAAHSTLWRRILTDPTTGTVLDTPALTYTPDANTRAVVNTKWQTCTAPGCTAPAHTTDFEHGIAFNHTTPTTPACQGELRPVVHSKSTFAG